MSLLPRLSRSRRRLTLLAAVTGGLVLAIPVAATASPSQHDAVGARAVTEVNLVSDLAGSAPLTDPDLVNPWGLALSATSPLWVANNGTDTSTLYTSAPDSATATKVPTIRVTFQNGPAGPTGQVFNGGTGFVLSNGTTSAPARFIFDTISGTIQAWSPQVDALRGPVEVKATVPGAVYTGLALATASAGDQLYAANFAQHRIDVFDTSFRPVTLPWNAFRDPFLPRSFTPFNVQAIGGNLFVTYALPDPTTGREVHARGAGFVDEFTPDGRFMARIASRQTLNAPWGVAIAPASWGPLAGDLLIGNFGDGRVSIVRAEPNGRFDRDIDGLLRNGATGRTLVIPGLWALTPGTAATGGTDALWFSAGPDNATHGVLGVLRKS